MGHVPLFRMSLETLAALLPLSVLARAAWGQTTAPGIPPLGPPAASSPGEALAIIALVVGVLVALGVVVKLLDLRKKREAEAVALQAQVSDALLREQALASLAVTVTAHIPLRRGSPATVEVRGAVPTPELRQAVLRLVEQETARSRSDYSLEDRVMVLPRVATAA